MIMIRLMPDLNKQILLILTRYFGGVNNYITSEGIEVDLDNLRNISTTNKYPLLLLNNLISNGILNFNDYELSLSHEMVVKLAIDMIAEISSLHAWKGKNDISHKDYIDYFFKYEEIQTITNLLMKQGLYKQYKELLFDDGIIPSPTKPLLNETVVVEEEVKSKDPIENYRVPIGYKLIKVYDRKSFRCKNCEEYEKTLIRLKNPDLKKLTKRTEFITIPYHLYNRLSAYRKNRLKILAKRRNANIIEEKFTEDERNQKRKENLRRAVEIKKQMAKESRVMIKSIYTREFIQKLFESEGVKTRKELAKVMGMSTHSVVDVLCGRYYSKKVLSWLMNRGYIPYEKVPYKFGIRLMLDDKIREEYLAYHQSLKEEQEEEV